MRARLTWLLALVVLVVLGSAAKIVDWRADSEMQQRFDASLLARAESLASLVQVEGDGVEVDAEDAATAVFPGNAAASWYKLSCNGRVVARTATIPPPASALRLPAFYNAIVDGRTLRTVALQFRPHTEDGGTTAANCTLRYALDRKSLDDILGTLDIILLATLLSACVLVMLLTPLMVRRGLRPLSQLGRTMAAIGPDAPGRRLPASSTDELVPLVACFNDVLTRMDAGLARERQFASGLAHEFRTRLAELRLLVDVERRYPGDRSLGDVLDDVGTIGAELEATVTALLRLTRLESGLDEARDEVFPLVPLVERVCDRHRPDARARSVSFSFQHAANDCEAVKADPALLEIIFDNLLGNAVAYAPAGTSVRIACATGGVRISNKASVLSAEDVAHFGQRFWRKGEPGMGHAGLGLALANAAARAMRMTLSFSMEHGELIAQLVLHRDAPGPAASI